MTALIGVGTFLLRNWLQIAIGAAVIFAVYKIDQNGYERAERAAQKREQAIQEQVANMEKRLIEQIGALDAALAGQVSQIDVTERTIVIPTITKEVASDPRFSDPTLGITRGMLDSINGARSLSSGAPVVDSGAVPAPAPAD